MGSNENEFDREIEDILRNVPEKKRVKSGAKGHRGEHGACRILSDRFGGRPFERVVGSGNRWAQVKCLPEHAKSTLLGDICAPEGFLWVLEVKNGYEDKVDFHSLFGSGSRQVDQFLDQAGAAGRDSGRKPMLLYKRSRRPWLAAVPSAELTMHHDFVLVYRNWSFVALATLLGYPDDFFFAGTTS